MSRRTLNTSEGSTNPAAKFLEWKSSEKCFQFWDKEKKENILVPLPIKIQFLEDFHTIKGYHEPSESQIYSNEVKTLKEELTVKSFKIKTPLAKGLYKDIKHEVKSLGGKYGKSVYALLNGEIVNLQLYGASITPFIFYTSGDKKTNVKGHDQFLESHFIEINSFVEKKKGANKYTEPVFSLGEVFNEDEKTLADEKYKDIVDYYNRYNNSDSNLERSQSAVDKYEAEESEDNSNDEIAF